MRRMARNHQGEVPKVNLTAIMDIYTTLVFFLLITQQGTEILESPEHVTLPASIAEEKPRVTVIVAISPTDVTVQGESVVTPSAILLSPTPRIEPIAARLAELQGNAIGRTTQAVLERREITILADRSVPFSVIKRVMSTCTSEGYAHISLAVLQKSPATQLSQN